VCKSSAWLWEDVRDAHLQRMRYCVPGQAGRRSALLSPVPQGSLTRGGRAQEGYVTDNLKDDASDTCRASTRPRSGQSHTSGEAFTFSEDTIAGRLWRVVDGWLECEATGGWQRVLEVTDSTNLARRLAWLSGANIVTANSCCWRHRFVVGGRCRFSPSSW